MLCSSAYLQAGKGRSRKAGNAVKPTDPNGAAASGAKKRAAVPAVANRRNPKRTKVASVAPGADAAHKGHAASSETIPVDPGGCAEESHEEPSGGSDPNPAACTGHGEEVPCAVCGKTGDDEVFLLCDKCQQPSHTFCVGLKKVPKGQWAWLPNWITLHSRRGSNVKFGKWQ